MSTTTATTEPKYSHPVASRRVVGCHSVIRPVTPGFVDSPTAYAQTIGPKGVRHAATTLMTATSSVRFGRGALSYRSSSQARPSTSGPRKKLPCRFAQTATTIGTSHSRRGWSRRSLTSSRTIAKQAMPRSCGRSASAGEATRNAAIDSQAARRAPEATEGPDRQEAAEDEADQRRSQDHEARPAAEPIGGLEKHLGAPLLVRPGQAEGGEGPRVRRRDGARVEDLAAGTQLVGQVHAGQAG